MGGDNCSDAAAVCVLLIYLLGGRHKTGACAPELPLSRTRSLQALSRHGGFSPMSCCHSRFFCDPCPTVQTRCRAAWLALGGTSGSAVVGFLLSAKCSTGFQRIPCFLGTAQPTAPPAPRVPPRLLVSPAAPRAPASLLFASQALGSASSHHPELKYELDQDKPLPVAST